MGKSKACLIYSIGSHGEYGFESSVHNQISSECDIHTFDMDHWSKYSKPPAFLTYHVAKVGVDKDSKSVPQIVKELKHTGRTIQLFKIDCEGCEYETVKGWLGSGVDIQQILVELHWRETADKVHKFFKFLFD